MTRVVLAVGLIAGISGVASAQFYNDNSVSRLGGDGYAYFNSQPIGRSPSAWRQVNPRGLSERVLQADSASSAASAWQIDKPVLSSVASDPTFKQTHPNGLTERRLQALSSEGPAWSLGKSAATVMASDNQPSAASQEFAARVTRFFDSSR